MNQKKQIVFFDVTDVVKEMAYRGMVKPRVVNHRTGSLRVGGDKEGTRRRGRRDRASTQYVDATILT